MTTVNVDALLKKVREKMQNPDIIVDPYDLTFVWVSEGYCKLTGYSCSDLIDKQLFFTSVQTKDTARKMEMDMLSKRESDIKEIPIKKKTGKVVIAKVKDIIINFENHPYMAGKLIKVIKK
ncbi:PAS domain-containing protein [Candidatus Woesearchaeota archaeon]|nr:PAS domain-containing protein [Candidatus Woesearchaeota archaeon]